MGLEQVETCPICQGKSFHPFLVCKDHTTTGELFHVEQCSGCGFVITNPRPPIQDSPAYYQSAEYISHTNASSSLFDTIYLIIRRFTMKWKLRLVQPILRTNGLLDVGCGTGSFLTTCARSGIKVHGIETSEKARTIASKNGIPVVSKLEELPTTQYDAITLWHVLEHIYDLRPTLEKLKGRLTENGTIFIAVPNRESPDANHFREMWAAYDVPRHLWHFSRKDMQTLIQSTGMKIAAIKPMKLDTYYVSLLSEKYKAGRLTIPHILAALYQALRCNLKADASTNHSSLIYQIVK